LQYAGAIYHLTVRGNGRRRIFRDDRDRERFLWRLSESRDLYEVRIYLFALMENHVHILAETPRANIARFMQSLLTGYTVYFNLRHNTCGHLLQGRYGAQLVQGDLYLLRLSRYIHLNPVHTREARTWPTEQKREWLHAYPWSSYRGYMDVRRSYAWIDYGPLLAMMQGSPTAQRRRYRQYVEAGLTDSDEELVRLMESSPRAVGDDGFRSWVDSQYRRLADTATSDEDVSLRREAAVIDPQRIVALVAQSFDLNPGDMRHTKRQSPARPVAAYLLCKCAGLSQREAAQHLGYGTGAAVSIQIKNLRNRLQNDAGIASALERLERQITHANQPSQRQI